ncbi:MAG: autotransporter-associated beta strand repeat-containing protein [Kiritimatiellae bacterium]|nr:autotransporter-associated beta strand repeat-containing protein [Kiritimatiellia bacterium]
MLTRSVRRYISTACFAVCAALTAVTATAVTINPDNYSNSVKIKFDGYNSGTPLINFPVLVELTDGVTGFRYSDMESDDYSDLRFTKDDGVTTIPFEVEEWKSALPVAAAPDTFNGCILWLRADAGAQTNAIGGVTNWVDQSGSGNHAASQAATAHPSLVLNSINGQPIVRFSGADDNYIKFPRLTTIRTVFWVIKEDSDAADSQRFLLGDQGGSTYDFHRGETKYIWNSSHAPLMFNGTTELNGNEINGRTTLAPTTMSVLSVRTAGNATANSLARDRNGNGRSWDGDVAELIIYNRVLTKSEINSVYLYLENKYAISIATAFDRTSKIWVQAPLLTNNASIFAYWGNPSATDIPVYATNGMTWSENYVGVWHMSGDTLPDSTQNGHDATATGTRSSDSLIGGGQIFADGDQITIPGHADLRGTESTMSLWFKGTFSAGGSEGAMLVDRRSGAGAVAVLHTSGRIFIQGNNGNLNPNNTYSTAAELNNLRWHHLVVTYPKTAGGTVRCYIDGQPDKTIAVSSNWDWPASQIELGKSHDGYWKRFIGAMDEFRISNSIRSADWIKAEYDNQSSPSTFATHMLNYYYDTSTVAGLQAGNGIWDNTTTLWSRSLDGSIPLKNWEMGAFAYFEADGTSVIIVDSVNAQKLVFNGTGYQLSEGSIALDRGGIEANQSATIASSITLNNPQAWTTAASKTLAVSGSIANNGNVLTTTGEGNATLSGVVSGSGALVKDGSGTTTLDANHTYAGGTAVNAGVLALNQGGSTGALRGTLNVKADGKLDLLVANALGYGAGTKVNTLNINGGLVNNTANGDNGWGITINMTGGELRSNAGAPSSSATQLYSLGGGSSINTLAGAGPATISGRINLSEGNVDNTLRFTVADDIAVNDLLLSAVITEQGGARAIAKSGQGLMNITSANTYSGGTIINQGTLLANNTSGLATGSGLTTVNGGVLGGAGTVGSVTFGSTGGELAPGNSVGTLNIAGDLSLTSSAWVNIEIDSSAVYDSINVTGAITLGDAQLAGSIHGAVGSSDKYFIVVNNGTDPVSGTFAGLPQGGSVDIDGQTFTVSYEGDFSSAAITGGNDVVLYNATTTPAPVGPFWREIGFPGYYRNSTLTNFPALIVFNEEMQDFTYTTFLSPAGGDLRFYSDQNKTMELNYEIEEWNTSGTSYVWVQVPELTKVTTIWAYWGDAGQSTAPLYTTDGSTWSAEYTGVWHLNEALIDETTGGKNADATANLNHGTQYNNTRVNAIISGGQRFGGNDYIEIPYSSSLHSNNFSISFWAKRESGTGHGAVVSARNEPPQSGYIIYSVNNRWEFWTGPGWNQAPATAHTLNDWDYVTVTFDGTTKRIYKEGVLMGQGVPPSFNINQSGNLRIGAGANEGPANYFFSGVIDEVRIANVARSDDWIWACYQNQNAPLAFTGETPASYWDTSVALGLQSGDGIWDSAASTFWSVNSIYGSSPLLTWDGTAPDAHFTAAGGGTITVASNVSVERMHFESAGYTLSGGTIELSRGIQANKSVTINSTISQASDQEWFIASNQGLTIQGNVNTASGVTLTKQGSGSLWLPGNGNNDHFKGVLDIAEGTATLADGGWYNAFTQAGTVSIAGGAFLIFAGIPYGAYGNNWTKVAGTLTVNGGAGFVPNLELAGGTVSGPGTLRAGGYWGAGRNYAVKASPNISTIACSYMKLEGNCNLTVENGPSFIDLEISAIIQNGQNGVSGINKKGAGKASLTASNTYSGITTIEDGTLLVNNTAGSGTGSGAVTINGGTLGGTGVVAGAVSFGDNGGAIAPGASVGTLTVNSNVTFTSAASLDVTVNGIDAGEYSTLAVNGAVDLADATLNVTLNTEISGGKPLFIIKNNGTDTVSGTFNGLPEGKTFKVNGLGFSLYYSANADTGATTGGNDVMLRSNPRGTFMILR